MSALLVAEAPDGYDLRFFCSSCHILDPAAHRALTPTVDFSLFPMDCTQCHRHEVSVAGSTELL